MDLENQQRVKDAAEKYGAENVVVILGSSDPEGAEIYAETVTLGDPTFAGPLAGVPLGLCVCHVLEPEIKAEADAAKWDEQIGMMEMVLNVDALADAVIRTPVSTPVTRLVVIAVRILRIPEGFSMFRNSTSPLV